MKDRTGTIDLTTLGFEISVPATHVQSSKDHDLPQRQGGKKDPQYSQSQQEWLPDNAEGLKHTIEAADDLSCMSLDTYDSFDDDDDDDDSYVLPTRNMPTKTYPRRMNNRCEPAMPSNADLGYADLGYVGDQAVLSSNQLEYDENTVDTPSSRPSASSLSLLSVGRPIRNRRSMGMGQYRRFTNETKVSTRMNPRRKSSCSADSASTGKMRRAHSSRSHNGISQRERMVSRSVSRRLGRQHPAQIPVVITAQDDAVQQTLQDLGCSEVFFDPRRRMPSRVSLQYDTAGPDQPRRISIEFNNSTHSNKSGSRMPRRVSLQFELQATSQDNDQTISSRRLRHVRSGSLGYSTGTSTLPRRGSTSPLSVRQQSSSERSSPRRPGSKRSLPLPCISIDNSLRSASSTGITRRASIASVPRQQMRDAAFGATAASKQTATAGHRRFSFKRCGSFQSTTPDAMVGSVA